MKEDDNKQDTDNLSENEESDKEVRLRQGPNTGDQLDNTVEYDQGEAKKTKKSKEKKKNKKKKRKTKKRTEMNHAKKGEIRK